MDVSANDCESVNVEFTKEVYQATLERRPEASVIYIIYIISDNASYYHNKKLEWVDGLKIKYIISVLYSPNLNLIETLWKFLRKKVINTGFCRTKEKFR